MPTSYIQDHALDLMRLTLGGAIVDAGCRDFYFAGRLAELGCQVIALDPDEAVVDPRISGVTYLRAALVGVPRASAEYAAYSTGEGNFLTHLNPAPPDSRLYQVKTLTLGQIMEKYSVSHFDLVKLDCEGAEFEILDHWPGPIATQISVEFHDFCGYNPEGQVYYDRVLRHLGQWYEVVRHQLSTLQGNNTSAYWDSLFVLR